MGNIQRFIVRAANRSLAFMKPSNGEVPLFYPYVSKSGMSVAANMRTAFREDAFFEETGSKALLSVCSPVFLMPKDEYLDEENFDANTQYNYTFTGHEHEEKICSVLPSLNAVAVYGVNKDLKLVVEDHFSDVRIQNVMQPVWEHLYRQSQLVTQRRKLYGYFHDGLLDIFSFQTHRFRYANAFPVAHAHDAMYYLLYVWKQLALDNEKDEMHLVGEMPHGDWLIEKLKQFLRQVYVINPVADLNRDPISQIKNLPYDMML